MSKRGKLSKAEEFYIQNNRDLSAEQVATDLDRTEEQVSTYVDELVKAEEVNSTPINEEVATEPAKKAARQGLIVGDLVARNVGRGVVVMTPAAAELSDATNKGRGTTKVDGIFRPMDPDRMKKLRKGK